MPLSKEVIPAHIRFLLSVYLLGLLFFALLRIILVSTNVASVSSAEYYLIFGSFFYGFRFDTSISCYLLALPFLLLSIGFVVPRLKKLFFNISFYIILVFYCIAFFISSADIPYFNHFGSRLTVAAMNWMESPLFMFKMIMGTFIFWIYLVPFIFMCAVFIKLVKREKDKAMTEFNTSPVLFNPKGLLVFFILAPVIFLGIRGRIAAKSPIVTGTAYFCSNNFLNQLGLNAVFTLLNSVLEDMRPDNKRLNLMEDEAAIDNVKKYLNAGSGFESPVARKINAEGVIKKMNVVLVIMESMSMYNMGALGGPTGLTPNLDSLRARSLWFKKIYTQGIHTFNGIYSSLFSYPSLMHKHPMREIISLKYHSMPLVLKENGYQNLFFITHDGQFDNVQGFLTGNGFDRVYAEHDYPADKVLSTLGVPDDYMFEFSIPQLNEAASKKENFFCGFMTGSNHHPLVFPDWAKINYKSNDETSRIIEYADWAIGKFMKLASRQSWYNNTIFVFVADHGANHPNKYDMPLSYHLTPLIIHAPGLGLEPKSFDCLGGQMDIFPTLMGLMNISYTNNTMGIDLLKETRPYIYFTADDKVGCIDKEYYFIHRNSTKSESLYKYETLSTDDYIDTKKTKADSMRTYAYAMLQATQWIVERKKFWEK